MFGSSLTDDVDSADYDINIKNMIAFLKISSENDVSKSMLWVEFYLSHG